MTGNFSYNQLRGLTIAAALAGAMIFLKLLSAALEEKKSAFLVLSLDDAAAACARSRYPLKDFLERAKAIGVGAAALQVETAASFERRGQVLFFSTSEIEKWRALGLIAPDAALKRSSLWTKRPELAQAAARAAELAGGFVSTSSLLGYRAVELAPDLDPAELPLGPDLEKAGAASAAGLGVRFLSDAPPAAAADIPPASLLRRFFSEPGDALLLRLDPEADVEKNLERLRDFSDALKALGVAPALATPVPPAVSLARSALLWLLVFFGPLTCARAGLRCLQKAQAYAEARFPVASPVFEVLCATAATAAAGLASGLALRALGGVFALEAARGPWRLLGPWAIGAVALWAGDWPELRKKLEGPMTYQALLKILAVLGLGALILRPGAAAACAGLSGLVEQAKNFSTTLWWWPWRWREALIGFPALIVALFAVHEKWNCPECRPPGAAEPRKFPTDPRRWLWLALLAPIGVQSAVGDCALPFGAALAQAAGAGLFGCLLAACVLAPRHWRR